MYLLIKIQMLNYLNIQYLVKTRLPDYLKKVFSKLSPLKRFQTMNKYSTLVL